MYKARSVVALSDDYFLPTALASFTQYRIWSHQGHCLGTRHIKNTSIVDSVKHAAASQSEEAPSSDTFLRPASYFER